MIDVGVDAQDLGALLEVAQRAGLVDELETGDRGLSFAVGRQVGHARFAAEVSLESGSVSGVFRDGGDRVPVDLTGIGPGVAAGVLLVMVLSWCGTVFGVDASDPELDPSVRLVSPEGLRLVLVHSGMRPALYLHRPRFTQSEWHLGAYFLERDASGAQLRYWERGADRPVASAPTMAALCRDVLTDYLSHPVT